MPKLGRSCARRCGSVARKAASGSAAGCELEPILTQLAVLRLRVGSTAGRPRAPVPEALGGQQTIAERSALHLRVPALHPPAGPVRPPGDLWLAPGVAFRPQLAARTARCCWPAGSCLAVCSRLWAGRPPALSAREKPERPQFPLPLSSRLQPAAAPSLLPALPPQRCISGGRNCRAKRAESVQPHPAPAAISARAVP